MAVAAGQDRRVPRPSSTSISFLLLVVLVSLAGVVVGNWLWLGSRRGAGVDVFVPLAWLLLPPLVILLVTAAVASLETRLMVARRRLEPVPGTMPGAVRFEALVAQAGLRRTPRLMYNPQDDGRSARSVGRPGHYVVIVSPAILGMARRRAATFDVVLRHELAHIRSGDVALATFAIRTWHVTLVALALPLVARLWDPDLSLLPSYLARAAVLAGVVYVVRAQVLRLREHHADVVATPGEEDVQRFGATLKSLAGPPHRSWLALHPTPARRAEVVADPGLLARPEPPTFLAAGFLVGAGIPVLEDVLSASAAPVGATSQLPVAVLGGLLGVLASAEILRARSPTARSFVVPAFALVIGLAAGAAASLGGTGLESWTLREAAEGALLGLVLGTLLLAGADAASGQRGHPTRLVMAVCLVLGGLVTALVAATWAPVAFLISMGALTVSVHTAVAASPPLGSLAPLAALLAFCAAMVLRRRDWRGVLVAAGVGTSLGLVAVLALRVGVGPLSGVGLQIAFTDYALAITVAVAAACAVVLTRRHGAAGGLLTAGLTAAGGAMVTVGVMAAARGAFDLMAAMDIVGRWASLAIVLILPVTGLVALIRRPSRVGAGPRIRWVVAGSAVLGVGLAAWAVTAGPAVLAEGERDDPVRSYLQQDLPFFTGSLEMLWDDATISTSMADPAQYLQQSTLPQYESLLVSAASAEGRVEASEDPDLQELHAAVTELMRTERDYWMAVAGYFEGTTSEVEVGRLEGLVYSASERLTRAYEVMVAKVGPSS